MQDEPATGSSSTPIVETPATPEATPSEKRDIVAITERHNTAQETGSLVRMKRLDWRLNSPLSAQINILKDRFSQGNAEAGFLLGANLRYCLSAPADQSALDAKLKQISEFSDAQESSERENRRFDYCKDIPVSQREQYFDYLFDSALAGFVQSQEYIGTIPAEQYMRNQASNEISRDEFIAIRNEFNQHKIAFLEAASKRGSLTALTRLSNMFNSQNYGTGGKEKAFALNQIILELTDNNEIYNRYTWLQQRLQTQLSIEDVDHAYVMAEQWLGEIHTNGTLYPAND